MSIENFKPTLWEDSIMENFHNTSFIGEISTPPVDSQGEKVVFNRIQKGVWKEYTTGKAITWDAVASTKVELTFPKQKYFAFMVDDCDAVQIKSDVLGAVTKEQSDVLGEEVDTEVIKHIASTVKPKNTIGTKDNQILIKGVNAYDNLVDLNVLANKAKLPITERVFIISPDYLGMLEKDDRFTREYSILQNGLLDGVTISGNKIICKADNPSEYAILTHKSATGYGMQLDGSAEAVRLQDYFADGVKGLVKYGYVSLRDDASFLAHIKFN